MLRVSIFCVGNLKEKYWRDACAEYVKRLSAFCKINVVEFPEEKLPDNPSDTQIARTIQAEGARMLAKIPTGAKVVALCIEGKEMSSPALANTVSEWMTGGCSDLVLVIGGSYGLSDEIKKMAHYRLSISPMTFPHQLARVLLLEQIYRAFQIIQGGKYHK